MKIRKLISLFLLMLLQVVQGMVDLNSNGMSDVWERKFDVVGIDPDLDSDHDGLTNLEESLAGTNPQLASSTLAITNMVQRPSAIFVSWKTIRGMQYQLKSSESMIGESWLNVGGVVHGSGEEVTIAIPKTQSTHSFYKVSLLNQRGDMIGSALPKMTYDTDGDGQSDLAEIAGGYDPLNNQDRWAAPVLRFGSGVELSWSSQPGKVYRIQSRSTVPLGEWRNVGSACLGTGGEVTATLVDRDGSQKDYRLIVSDLDSDQDRVNDWEELQVGLDPNRVKTDTLAGEDLQVVLARIAAVSVVDVKADGAVANITRVENGGFLIERTGGLDELTVNYTVSGSAEAGSDYEALAGSVTIPFGKDSVVVPVTPLASSSMSLSKSVILTLQDSSTYDLGLKDDQQVNVIKEVAMNVQDYGATGNGVTDDTAAIQSAIEALETSPDHNTLYFPAGTYRLNSYVRDYYTVTSTWHILKFGILDHRGNHFSGRDFVISGDAGATLYSTVSPTRAHMMIVRGTFRSLSCYNMIWEKDSTPLSEKVGGEPNGSDAVSLVAKDLRIVEHVDFQKCKFLNCHGALMITANGYDRRGHLRKLSFYDCDLLNPYGSNTVNSVSAWGGGQQVYLSQWVGDAIFEQCRFEGGGEDMTDGTTSPGGRLKDAAVIGGPQRLFFRNNVVKRMGIEAVFHNGRVDWMNQTADSFVMPPSDGNTEVSVLLYNYPTTFEAGQNIVIRRATTATVPGKNNLFRVTSYDQETRIVSFVNDGYPANDPPGTRISSKASIYLDRVEAMPLSIVENNLIEGYFPPGADNKSFSVGVTMLTNAKVRENLIKGYVVGVMSYEDEMPHPWSSGLTVDSNLILTADSRIQTGYNIMGVRLLGDNQYVMHNCIFSPLSESFSGIGVHGDHALIQNNHVIALEVLRHDYTSPIRSIALGVGNRSTNVVFNNNCTYGFDVGVGPLTPSQSIPYQVINHHSVNDTLPIDPRGLIVE